MDAHLLFAAEQYAAAQASAAAAAQYYASAAMNAAAGGGPSGAVLLPPGTLVMSQPAAGPQLVSLPPSHTWSGAPGPGQLPPAPPPPQYSGQDLEAAREREQWDEQRRRRDRSRERRHRRQRSRSRSRSQEPESRDRRRRRERSRSWSRGRDPEEDYREPSRERSRWSPRRSRDRDRSPGSRRFRGDSPGSETEDWRTVPGNDTIMIRGLPLHVTEQHVQDNIMSHGLEARDIRLIRKKDTGASRGFAFVEFSSVEDARKWIEAQQGWLTFSGSRVSMQFSVPRDQRAYEQPRVQSDWICAKCGVQNFRRRDACFKCNAPRSEYDSAQVNDETDEVSTHPTNTVLLSGLDALTTEDSVLNVLGPLTKLPLKNVKVGRDPLTSMSRGVCYVEMNSVVDAMFLHNQLIAAPPAIDGKTAEVSYHKQAGPGQVASSSQHQAAAHSAMAAAQWTNKSGAGASKRWSERELSVMAEYSAEMYAKTEEERRYYVEYYTKYYREGGDTTAAEVALAEDREGDSQAKEKKGGSELGVVVVEGVEYKKYPTPDTSKYQYDDTSGYYYDPVSTLYYDANSQYYYNSKTSKFYYWDHRHETFLPAPSSGTEKKEEEKKVSSKEKVKSAKKIQKDMEKWAKTLNQRKDQSRAAVDVPSAANGGGSSGKGSEDIAFNVLQRKDEGAAPGLAGLAGYGSDEEEEEKTGAGAGMAVAEMKLTDWAGLACLLCQRQFKSRDQLTKHNTMSELHTANMRSWRAQYSDPGEAGAGGQYRDRAKERRNKFGDDDKPIPNRFKEKFLKALDTSSSIASASGSGDLASAPKLTDNNIGNKMLQKMGWKDGQGLGKKKQGRTDIIIAQQRTQGVGLGTEQAAINPAANYKETAKTAIWARYNRADRECDY